MAVTMAMASRQRRRRGTPEQQQHHHRQHQQRQSSSMLAATAVATSFIAMPSAVAAASASSRRIQQQQQQQSNAELIELFDQVTNNQTTLTTSSTIALITDGETTATMEKEEVVSGGTVYATCPDLSAVTGPMYESDINSDGFINQAEYVLFTDAISGGFLTSNGWEDGFNDMPLALQETYLVLSCLCELYPGQPWGGVGCCQTNDITGSNDGTGIRTDGAAPGTTPNSDQLQYLTYVCGTMSESLENVGGTIVSSTPTVEPTGEVTSSEPTKQPVMMPTSVPEPTDEPTVEIIPTLKPTRKPTKKPSKKPTPTPVQLPDPTKSPVVIVEPSPTKSPVSLVPTMSPSLTIVPTIAPTVSIEPTLVPTLTPISSAPTTELAPSISLSPSTSSYPSNLPTISSPPTVSSAPSILYTGEFPVVLAFVASLNGQVTAEEVMEGTTNQVKLVLEEQLLVLSDIVIEEEFGSGSSGSALTTTTNTTEVSNTTGARAVVSLGEPTRLLRRRATTKRILVVEEAISAVVDDVQDAACPSDVPTNEDLGCFNFTNTIILRMVDEDDAEAAADLFEDAMLTKIADGWLNENFDLEEALKPPPSPTPSPNSTVDRGESTGSDTQPLSTGAIIGIVIAGLIICMMLILLISRNRRDKSKDTDDVERQASPNESELAKDGFDESSGIVDDSSSVEKSFSSQDHLLQGQLSSTADMPPALEKLQSDDESEMVDLYDTPSADFEEQSILGQSALGVMAAASTLVASSSNLSPTSVDSYSTMDVADSSSTMDLASDHSISISDSLLGRGDSGVDSSDATAGVNTSEGGGESGVPAMARAGGMSPGTAAAIGATGAAVVVGAAGVAAVGSRLSDKKEEESKASTTSTPNSTMDDLENAIEAGNWGQVGALAAVLASQGTSLPGKKSSRSAAGLSTTSYDSSAASSSRGSQSNNIDQARALEIDKLVEAGDWQGVVLAAARFEADQTFDVESVSASASQSSRYTGSAASGATPRSMATGDMSTSNVSNQRGQEEIRAEVEALVRRVVPEEADNIDEMLTQFKGREEELVETLRRMQERAIASRARLAVQKSAKLEARAKANPRGTSVSSAQSIASAGSTKSELEQAIEAGNWHAVGLAAQKMSDSSIGDLSSAEKARLRDAISASPAFSRRTRGTSDEVDHLDQLIEQGDWQGVIAAAKRASEGAGEDILDEQEALDQANMWQEIADQSKQEARLGPAGAGDAAAWAISRSLNALNTAEESTTAVRTIHDIADEQSTDASQYESSSYGDSAGRSSQDEFRHGI